MGAQTEKFLYLVNNLNREIGITRMLFVDLGHQLMAYSMSVDNVHGESGTRD
jgi:hypothetical protein